MPSPPPPESTGYHYRAQPGEAQLLKAEGVRWRNVHPRGVRATTRRSSPQKDEKVVTLYTEIRPRARDDHLPGRALGPVSPRTYPPAPGCSPDGHRIKAPLEYSRGPEKVWVYGALRVRDGQALTLTHRSRNTEGYLRLLSKPSSGRIRAETST